MGSVSGAPSPGSFAGVHFGLVSASGSLISGLELVPVIFGADLVPVFSEIPCACALAIMFGCVSDFVFTFACTRSSCSPKSLCAALALPRAFALVE
jgi:hypothetical protein